MNTDARATALRYYRTAGRDPHADLRALARNPQGVFLFSPNLVVLMKPVQSHTPDRWQELNHCPPESDGWYIHLLVGNLQLAARLAAALPGKQWLCFHRGLRSPVPHRLPWSVFCKKATN
jgi:hypothetical protein